MYGVVDKGFAVLLVVPRPISKNNIHSIVAMITLAMLFMSFIKGYALSDPVVYHLLKEFEMISKITSQLDDDWNHLFDLGTDLVAVIQKIILEIVSWMFFG